MEPKTPRQERAKAKALARGAKILEKEANKEANPSASSILIPKFSQVSKDGRCPKCKGAALKAKRSAGNKLFGLLLGGVGILLMPKNHVKCQSCGTEYRRG